MEGLAPIRWNSLRARTVHLHMLARKLNVYYYEDWYEIREAQLIAEGGNKLLSMYSDSLHTLLCHLQPNHAWQPWRFAGASKWVEEMHLVDEYLGWIAMEMNIRSVERWYGIQKKHLQDRFGSPLLRKYADSIGKVLSSMYPEYPWHMWRFASAPTFWDNMDNHMNYMKWLQQQLQVNKPEDWYNVTPAMIIERNGEQLLERHDYSVHKLLNSVYGEFTWHPWLFNPVPRHYWDNLDHQESYILWLSGQLSINTPEQWHKVKLQEIREEGNKLLGRYNYSLFRVLMHIFPEYPWCPWQFDATRHLFANSEDILEYLMWLSDQLAIATLDEWCDVSLELVTHFRGNSLVEKESSWKNILEKNYPQHVWKDVDFQSSSRKRQKLLFRIVRELIPNTLVESDFMHPYILFGGDRAQLEFDIFVPALSLALEYHGEQHYVYTTLYGSPFEQQQRDAEKSCMCRLNHITLVQIPHWWQFDKRSVVEAIRCERPDIFLREGRSNKYIY